MFAMYPEFLILISVVFMSAYYTLLKKFPGHMIILYFWLHTLSYASFALIYLYQKDSLPLHMKAIEQLVFDTTYVNFPLYMLSAACLLGTYIILDNLIKKYPVPKVLALSQISLVISTIGYIVLGDKTSTISLIGISIIFTGAIISGLQSFSWKHPMKSFASYDINLLKQSIIKAIFYAATIIITYLCTAQYSEITKYILHLLTKHLHFVPFTAIAPLHFNVGVQFSSIIFMLLFIHYYLKETDSILIVFKKNYKLILPIAAFYTLNAYFYYAAFDMIENKNLITAVSKLYLPLTLAFCYFTYNQKASREQIVGMAIIVLGSVISVFG